MTRFEVEIIFAKAPWTREWFVASAAGKAAFWAVNKNSQPHSRWHKELPGISVQEAYTSWLEWRKT